MRKHNNAWNQNAQSKQRNAKEQTKSYNYPKAHQKHSAKNKQGEPIESRIKKPDTINNTTKTNVIQPPEPRNAKFDPMQIALHDTDEHYWHEYEMQEKPEEAK